jgi:hypothetical protein
MDPLLSSLVKASFLACLKLVIRGKISYFVTV